MVLQNSKESGRDEKCREKQERWNTNIKDEIWTHKIKYTLYKMGKHDTGRCEFCGQEESVEHVILYGQKYETERRILMQNLEEIKMIYYKITREINAKVLFFSTLK